MLSKKKIRDQIQELLDESRKAYQAGNIKLYMQHVDDAYFLSLELKALKGF